MADHVRGNCQTKLRKKQTSNIIARRINDTRECMKLQCSALYNKKSKLDQRVNQLAGQGAII